MINERSTKIKIIESVVSTPNQPIKNPPQRAPETEAVFQVLVLQVAAL